MLTHITDRRVQRIDPHLAGTVSISRQGEELWNEVDAMLHPTQPAASVLFGWRAG